MHIMIGTLVVVVMTLGVTTPGSAQCNPPSQPTYILSGGTWGVTPTGTLVSPTTTSVIDLRATLGFDPAIHYSVTAGPWGQITFSQLAGPSWSPPLPGGVATNNVVGCSLFANTTQCCSILGYPAGVYTIEATFGPLTAPGTVILGGGARSSAAGPTTYQVVGFSDGGAYSYGLSLGNTNPIMTLGTGLPSGSPAPAFVVAFVAGITGAYPAFVATVGPLGPDTFTVDTIPTGIPFRFWVGNGIGIPTCQVTGNSCSFNPTITDISAQVPIPATSTWALGILALGLAAAAALLLRKRISGARIVG